MTLKPPARALALLCALALPGTLARASADGPPRPALRSLDIDDVKVQWFAQGEEDLPAWISAHFTVGPLGAVTGTMTEVELAADGADEDGDPLGFETSVFESSDGTLRDISLGSDGFAFTAVYPGKDASRVAYAGHPDTSQPRGWVLSAVSRGPKGDAAGHNRFPLSSAQKKDGNLEIFTDTEQGGLSGGQSI
jgi:hypothetical protein